MKSLRNSNDKLISDSTSSSSEFSTIELSFLSQENDDSYFSFQDQKAKNSQILQPVSIGELSSLCSPGGKNESTFFPQLAEEENAKLTVVSNAVVHSKEFEVTETSLSKSPCVTQDPPPVQQFTFPKCSLTAYGIRKEPTKISSKGFISKRRNIRGTERSSRKTKSSVSSLTKGTYDFSNGVSLDLLRRRMPVQINLTFTKYKVLLNVSLELNWSIDYNELTPSVLKHINIIWSDTVLSANFLLLLRDWQRTNHFPAMHILCRKCYLNQTLKCMRHGNQGVLRHAFSYFPRAWSLSHERASFEAYLDRHRHHNAFIYKPNAGAQGKGIILIKDPLTKLKSLGNGLVQEYISRPLLIDQKKFDLRVYVLITSVIHPSIFMFNNGLVRLCAKLYERPEDCNLNDVCRHLTNYAINKYHEDFVPNTDAYDTEGGSKRDFLWLNKWLGENGTDPMALWTNIEGIICKTILSAIPSLQIVYQAYFPPSQNSGFTCFEILGFDILIDANLNPWLLEVNHTPSFSCGAPLDQVIKHSLIMEALQLLSIKGSDRYSETSTIFSSSMGNASSISDLSSPVSQSSVSSQSKSINQMVLEKEDQSAVNFRRLYPSKDPERQRFYETILQAAKSINMPFSISKLLHHPRPALLERTLSSYTGNKNSLPNTVGGIADEEISSKPESVVLSPQSNSAVADKLIEEIFDSKDQVAYTTLPHMPKYQFPCINSCNTPLVLSQHEEASNFLPNLSIKSEDEFLPICSAKSTRAVCISPIDENLTHLTPLCDIKESVQNRIVSKKKVKKRRKFLKKNKNGKGNLHHHSRNCVQQYDEVNQPNYPSHEQLRSLIQHPRSGITIAPLPTKNIITKRRKCN